MFGQQPINLGFHLCQALFFRRCSDRWPVLDLLLLLCSSGIEPSTQVGASLRAGRVSILRVIIVVQVYVSHLPFKPVENRIPRVLCLAGFQGEFTISMYRLEGVLTSASSAPLTCVSVSSSLTDCGVLTLLRFRSTTNVYATSSCIKQKPFNGTVISLILSE